MIFYRERFVFHFCEFYIAEFMSSFCFDLLKIKKLNASMPHVFTLLITIIQIRKKSHCV